MVVRKRERCSRIDELAQRVTEVLRIVGPADRLPLSMDQLKVGLGLEELGRLFDRHPLGMEADGREAATITG